MPLSPSGLLSVCQEPAWQWWCHYSCSVKWNSWWRVWLYAAQKTQKNLQRKRFTESHLDSLVGVFCADVSLRRWGLYRIPVSESVEGPGFSEIRPVEAKIEVFPLWEFSCPCGLGSGGFWTVNGLTLKSRHFIFFHLKKSVTSLKPACVVAIPL